ncbi:MAG: hypothetical protein JKX98_12115 [Alcanivoracaceae bacterium]|nr:hypothetical protein [Alcanivoracaceae bacterium]
MESAFVSTQGTLSDKLMAALQAAKRVGAYSHCNDLNISLTSAFIRLPEFVIMIVPMEIRLLV